MLLLRIALLFLRFCLSLHSNLDVSLKLLVTETAGLLVLLEMSVMRFSCLLFEHTIIRPS